MAKPGTLYLIPLPIADGALHTILPSVIERIHDLDHFVAENARTARRFISSTKPPYRLEEVEVREIPKHDLPEPEALLQGLLEGTDFGLMSEAGCPGVADPGSDLVAWAHKHEVRVVPLVGPSSILLALMASGMNGQHFAFHGYLPREKRELVSALKRLEKESQRIRSSQIFIETPYRNHQVIDTAIDNLKSNTLLTIACEMTSDSEFVKTKSIGQWKGTKVPDLHKRPAVFVISTNR